ncbi:MAG: HAD family hydrolase [Candidatus Woesearchaeota archaeon]
MKAVIFELDGVIIESEQFNYRIIKDVLAKENYAISEETYKEYFLGKKIKESLKDFLGKDHSKASKLAKECIEYKKERIKTNQNKPREGIIDCIKRLYKDFSLGLITSSSKDMASLILRQLNLSFYFEEIVFGDDIHSQKPDPEGLFLCAQKLRRSPHDCIVIDNSRAGIEAANDAGMKVIAVPNEFTKTQNLSDASVILKNFDSIDPDLIKRLAI